MKASHPFTMKLRVARIRRIVQINTQKIRKKLIENLEVVFDNAVTIRS
jgi:hypothetical protein